MEKVPAYLVILGKPPASGYTSQLQKTSGGIELYDEIR